MAATPPGYSLHPYWRDYDKVQAEFERTWAALAQNAGIDEGIDTDKIKWRCALYFHAGYEQKRVEIEKT